MPNDRKWNDYCVTLRMQMFRAEEFQSTVDIEDIHSKSGTVVSLSELRKPAYWSASQAGKRDWEGAKRNGIELDFDVEDDGNVHRVTFRLDDSRKGTLERFIERRLALQHPQS